MEVAIIIVLLILLFAIWIRVTRKKLKVMNENVNNAMGQIGVQLASRFDVLSVLLNVVKGYEDGEVLRLINTVESQRNDITATSTPKDVLGQEGLISEALIHAVKMAERYPELKEDINYAMCIDAADSYKKMVQTSSLIYNDSVRKLNGVIGRLPDGLIAGLLGFRQREYLKYQ